MKGHNPRECFDPRVIKTPPVFGKQTPMLDGVGENLDRDQGAMCKYSECINVARVGAVEANGQRSVRRYGFMGFFEGYLSFTHDKTVVALWMTLRLKSGRTMQTKCDGMLLSMRRQGNPGDFAEANRYYANTNAILMGSVVGKESGTKSEFSRVTAWTTSSPWLRRISKLKKGSELQLSGLEFAIPCKRWFESTDLCRMANR